MTGSPVRLFLLFASLLLAVAPAVAEPPLFRDDFDITPPAPGGPAWETLDGTTVRETLDGSALGLMVGAKVLSTYAVSDDPAGYTFTAAVSSRYGDPGILLFSYRDERTYLYLGICAMPTGARSHLGLFMVLDGKEEKLGESPLLPLPYGGLVSGVFKVHVRAEAGNLVIAVDRDGLGNGRDYELEVVVTKKEAVERLRGGRVGIANVYAGGRPRSRAWLVFDSVRIARGMVRDTPARAAVSVYVDGAGGSDENPGTKEQPVGTIAKALALSQPGDEVVVLPGKYDKVLFPGGRIFGTPEKKVTIRSEQPLKAAVAGIAMKGADCVRVEGFEVVDEGISVSGKGNEVRGCYIHDLPAKTGIDIKGENHLIVGNHIQRVSYGVVVDGKNNRVEGNDIEQLVWGPGAGDCDYVRFFGEGHRIVRNYLHGTKKEEIGPAHVDGFQSFAVNPGQHAKDIVIDANILVGHLMHGVIIQGRKDWDGMEFSTANIIVRNNVFADGNSIALVDGARNVQFTNNTFINNALKGGLGITVRPSLDAASTVSVRNNIFYNCAWYMIPKILQTTGCLLEGEKNLRFVPQLPPTRAVNPVTGDIMNQDPLFVDPANPVGADGKPFTADDGYRLKTAGSPCIDAGAKLDDASVARDIFGTPRPQGAGWDIGAQEAVSEMMP